MDEAPNGFEGAAHRLQAAATRDQSIRPLRHLATRRTVKRQAFAPTKRRPAWLRRHNHSFEAGFPANFEADGLVVRILEVYPREFQKGFQVFLSIEQMRASEEGEGVSIELFPVLLPSGGSDPPNLWFF